MTLLTLLELENTLKINQLLNNSNSLNNNSNNQYSVAQQQQQSNLNFMLQNASVTKANLFTNAMLQQIHQNNMNNANNSSSHKNLFLINNNNNNGISVNNSETSQKNQINTGRYKTELCRQFIENGGCKYGDKCQFAHGAPDLKDVNRHPKYKTDYCKTFHSKGFCPYGPRCHFIHEINEKTEETQSSSTSIIKKSKTENNINEESQVLNKQIDDLHIRLSNNLFVKEDFNAKQNHYKQSNLQHQTEDLNSSFLSVSSPPSSPVPQRTRSGTSSVSSIVSSSSSYDLNQSQDRIFSPNKSSTQRPSFHVPISKNLIQIGRNLIYEKLTNPSQDQATLNQQIYNIERLNNLLNSNQLNFYQQNTESNNRPNSTW